MLKVEKSAREASKASQTVLLLDTCQRKIRKANEALANLQITNECFVTVVFECHSSLVRSLAAYCDITWLLAIVANYENPVYLLD